MGWSGASEYMNELIRALNETSVPEPSREVIYGVMIESFAQGDWDTEDECTGKDPALDRALAKMPWWREYER